MKTKITLPLTGFVFSLLISQFSFASTPSAAWRDAALTSTISVTTMDPDTSIAGGSLGQMAVGDFNCDGKDDLAVATGASRYGKVYIHLGSSTGFSSDVTDADFIVTGTVSRQYLGLDLENVEDIDGDSCPELVVVGDNNKSSGKMAYFLYKSSAIAGWASDSIDDDDYTDSDADSYLESSAAASDLYAYVNAIGKINGESDGEYLSVCSDYKFTCYFMPVSALAAGTGTMESNSDYWIYSVDTSDSIAGGDVDGDGVDDLIIGSPGNSRENVTIIFGPISDSTSTFAGGYHSTNSAPGDENIVIWNGDTVDTFGSVVKALDVDNDGKKEILIGYPGGYSNAGVYYLISGFENLRGVTNEMYSGSSTGTYNFSSGELEVAAYYGETSAYLGYDNNAAVADFNGDGYDDLFLGGNNCKGSYPEGCGFLLYNRAVSEGLPSAPSLFEDDFGDEIELSSSSSRTDAHFEGAASSDQFTKRVLAGDFDGDGDAALVIFAPNPNSSYGQITIIEMPDDADEDGVEAKEGDCNDTDATVGAPSTWYADSDGDGKGDLNTTQTSCAQPTGYVADNTDCDDTDATLTTPTWYWDEDRDGYGGSTYTDTSCDPVDSHGAGTWVANNDDCNDANSLINPDTVWYLDSDRDSYGNAASSTISCNDPSTSSVKYVLNDDDCDDADKTINPTTTWYADSDGDTYGDSTAKTQSCTQPTGYVKDKSDCNDTDATLNPKTVWYVDADSDSYGSSSATRMSCTQPTGYVSNNSDCNDSNASLNPNTVWYADADGDTYGDVATTTVSCTEPTGYVANSSDCNDADSAINPTTVWYLDSDGDTCGDSASTVVACEQPSGYVATATDCDDTDSTLNDKTIWYADADGDGYGDASLTATSCGQPTGYVADDTDCNDSDPTINPKTLWYADADGDGYGDASVSTVSCEQPTGYIADASDCDDASAAINPTTTWYADTDGDGLGDPSDSLVSCEAPTGYVADASDDDTDGDGYNVASGDCNDADATIFPDASETATTLGDGLDNDCDGRIDEGLMTVTIDAATLPSGSVTAGDTFDLDVNITNNTGLNDFTVVVLVPNSPTGAGGGVWTLGSGFAARFCSTVSSCTTLGDTSFTLSSGSTDTITIPTEVVSGLAAGRYPIHVLVLNSDGNVQARTGLSMGPGKLVASRSLRIY